MKISDIVTSFLKGRHTENNCPCRKRHHVAPIPQAPPGPPNKGKQSGHLRKAIEDLAEAQTLNDQGAELAARTRIATYLPGLEDYAAQYSTYKTACAQWSSEICQDCGSSLLCSTATCAYCLSSDAESLIEKLKEATP
jgi:hypothetical protein